jgi:hypothetical protein
MVYSPVAGGRGLPVDRLFEGSPGNIKAAQRPVPRRPPAVPRVLGRLDLIALHVVGLKFYKWVIFFRQIFNN